MERQEIRLYYKNQLELGYALRDYIDAYFQNKIMDKELEEKIVSVIECNRDKFYKDDEIAQKPKQILGKTRLNVLKQILNKKGEKSNEEGSYTK